MAVFVHFVLFCFLLAVATCVSMKRPCKYVKAALLLDCSDRGLDRIPVPGAKEKKRSVRVLDLRRNNITLVNEKYVVQLYPGLVMIDFRENPIICTGLSFSKVKIINDCKSSARRPQTNTTLIPTMHTTMISQNCYKTALVDSSTLVSSSCRSCVAITKKRVIPSHGSRLVRISSVVKSGIISPNVRDEKTKIILLSTIIPVIIFMILSIIIYGICSRHASRQNTEERNENIEFQIGSTTTVETDGSSSIELYTTQL